MRISIRGNGDGVRVRMRFEVNRRRWLIIRIILWVLTIQGIVVGAWAVVAPRSWYTSFPGLGMRWISADGPYNHHLAADVGAFFLALAAVTGAALYYGDSLLARVAGLGWVVFGVPHLIYHLVHKPAEMGAGSFVLSVIAAALLPILGLAAILVAPAERTQLRDPAPLNIRFRRRRER
ncbi:hypothetical protein GV791_02515 [Nocardia cyriacigeorgica]|nr:hypothetical protein [Nocardia cyriacigeorgica]MBF6425099.1 hypothetical protein [Nocardia cyriacigeorgica]NEW31435.1 hypothetical protein [Nocardia cyriacigeorgica]BDT84245.1 hypothetical protein FMUAM8_00090 [Nocardia cyriacigeorgica]